MLIVQPDILYVFYIVINGRLEASGMKSVYCVLSQSSHHIYNIINILFITLGICRISALPVQVALCFAVTERPLNLAVEW